MTNIYKNCSDCRYKNKSYSEKPCVNCFEKNVGDYKKKNWKAKNPFIWFLAFMED